MVVYCEFKVRGLLRPAFLRSAGNLVFSDLASTHTSLSQGTTEQDASASMSASTAANTGAYRGFQTFMGPELLGYLENGMITLSVAMRAHAHEGQLLGMAGPSHLSDNSPITPPFLSVPVPPIRVKRARSTHAIDTACNTPAGSAAAAALATATTLSTVATHQVAPPQAALDLAPNPTHPNPKTPTYNPHLNPPPRRRLHVPPPAPPCLSAQTLPPLEDIYLQQNWHHEVFIAGNPKTAWGQQQQQQKQQQQQRSNAPPPLVDQSHNSPVNHNIPDTNPYSSTTQNPAISPAAAATASSVVASSMYPSNIRTLARRRLAPRLVATTTHSL